MADNRSGAGHELAQQEHAHPGTRTYIMVAVVLTIITAAEVAVAYMPALRPVLAYILMRCRPPSSRWWSCTTCT